MDNESYQKNPGTSGIGGQFYEIGLLTLAKLRGSNKTDKFLLAGNMAGAGAFDDMVLKFWHNGDEKANVIFLQAKHRDNPGKGKVTIEKFITQRRKDDDFYLVKYFLHYLKIKKRFNRESKDPLFGSNFNDLNCHFIIYTNALLDEKFNMNWITNVGNNPLLTTNENGISFKFKLDHDGNSELINVLVEVAIEEMITLLAKNVSEYIFGKKNICLQTMMSNELMQSYHVFLSQNVIEVQNTEKEYRIWRFRNEFLKKTCKDFYLEKFREELFYAYAEKVVFGEKTNGRCKKSRESMQHLVGQVINLLKSKQSSDIDVIIKLSTRALVLDKDSRKIKFAKKELAKDNFVKQFIEELESKLGSLADYTFDVPYELLRTKLANEELKLHVDFGNMQPKLVKPHHLAKKLINLFNNGKSERIVEIYDNMVGHGKQLTHGDVKNIAKLVGKYIVLDKEIEELKFSNREITDESVQELINALSKEGLSTEDLYTYSFDFKIKKFPRLSLVEKYEARADVNEFLSNLEIFTGQASCKELEVIIRNEVREYYQLTEEENDESFLKLRTKVMKWWEEKGTSRYLKKGDNFFESDILRFNIVYNVNLSGPLFTGREKELSDLHNFLKGSEEKTTVISQFASISGLGGIGKTELARKYICKYKRDYDGNVIWIDSENFGSIAESFRRLAQDKLGITTKTIDGKERDIKSIVNEVYTFFARRKSLFIFDNAEKRRTQNENDEGIDKFLPSMLSGVNKPYILITSRNQKWGNIKVLRLGTFTKSEAAEFVRKALELEEGSQREEVRKLVETLQYFPLALQQAVAYIKERNAASRITGLKFDINDYLIRFEAETKKLLDFNFPEDSDDLYTKTTYTTWKITTDKIKENQEYGKQALEILNSIAYIAPNTIPVKIFLKSLEINGDQEKLGDAVQLLKQYSMVNVVEEKCSINVHRLVQQVTRIQCVEQNREKEVLRNNLRIFENNLDTTNVDFAMASWNYAKKYDELVREFSALPSAIIIVLIKKSRFEDVLLFEETSSKTLENVLGRNHPDSLAAKHNMVAALDRLGKFDEALKLYEDIYEIDIKTFGAKHVNALNTKKNIAGMLSELGRYEEALKMYGEVCKEGKLLLGEDNNIILNNECDMALVLKIQGKHEEALHKLNNVFTKRKKILGINHKDTLRVWGYIATALFEKGNYNEALDILKEVTIKLKELLGKEHPDTLNLETHLAAVFSKLCKYDEALSILQRIYKIQKQTIGEDNLDTLSTKSNIAVAFDSQGKYDEALEIYREVYKGFEQTLETDHKDTLIIKNNMASTFDKKGNYAEALRIYQEILPKFQRTLGPDHPITITLQNSIMITELKLASSKTWSAKCNLAAKHGQLEDIKKIITDETDINVKESLGLRIPLHFAAETGHLEIVNILLQNGAYIEAVDVNHSTPLHYAALNNHEKVVIMLLKNGANINCVDFYDKKPIEYTSDNAIKCILKSTNDLLGAVITNDLYKIKELVKMGGIINAVYDEHKLTLLHHAALDGSIEIVEFLLDMGANINDRDKDDWTPMHYAAQRGERDVVQALIKEGANIDARTILYKTPMDIAKKYDNVNIFPLLSS